MNTTEKQAPEQNEQSPVVPTLRLLYTGDAGVVSGPPRVLQAGETSIGRGEEATVCLSEDRRASRLHAVLRLAPGKSEVQVTDNGSTNGTFIGGRRVQDGTLRARDILRVGDSFFLFRCQPLLPDDGPIPTLIGSAPATCALRATLHRAARVPATVLLTGESGSGKEVAARALHDLGGPGGRPGPFVAVNCSALPETLAESLLFGHVAGAFTGASHHPGFFRAATGGTLFLDEVGDLPLALQPKLLRVLEERAVVPVGAVSPVPCAVRVIAATHRDLQAAVLVRQFRGDLYARLLAVHIALPPLRERGEDILPLFLHALGLPSARLTPRLIEALLLHPWPYNVREVFTVAAQLLACSPGTVQLDLPPVAQRLAPQAAQASSGSQPVPVSAPGRPARAPRKDLPIPPREELLARLHEHQGRVAQVAHALGCSRFQVYRWLRYHNLPLHGRLPRAP